MKQFTIRTSRHEASLKDFAARAAAAEMIYINNVRKTQTECALKFAVVRREPFCALLLTFLADTAALENPVYRHSAKLREMALSLRKTPLFKRELRLLREFFAQNSELNVEGYTTFRMFEFREKLDTMIYTLVKKIKFGGDD
ncbi:MAG: hypothetical protein FWC70_08375 [Defluviitaleaceae bacterium]|nr:hypothetical protein [Defluviitaleaceae bacterium]